MKNKALQKVIILPIGVSVGIVAGIMSDLFLENDVIAMVIFIVTIGIGAAQFFYDILRSLIKGKFGLDYIALAAIVTAFLTQEYLVGAVIVLMLTTGEALEKYAMLRAKKSLTALIDRIPKDVTVIDADEQIITKTIESVRAGEKIMIRRGEVIPLDGILESEVAMTDESSLTGEPYFMDKQHGDVVRSGTINVGDVMIITVTTANEESTYRKIIDLVQQAQESQAPLVRLADRYSKIFTFFTAAIVIVAYLFTRDTGIVLSILVVATPCPLLLATPIALMGGMSASAREKIIMKNLASIEVLSRAQALLFDKTGTITFGKPSIERIDVQDDQMTEEEVLSIAAAIEHNSLHPIAKSIVHEAKEKGVKIPSVTGIKEVIGVGISGIVGKDRYMITKHVGSAQMIIELKKNDETCALFHFQDAMKQGSQKYLQFFEKAGFEMFLLTGDKQTIADTVAASLGIKMNVQGDCSPEDKLARIRDLQKEGKVTVMIGDGINDAPALAAADVGIVFANEEHTAASEAADIVILGGDIAAVQQVLHISQRTIRIALQSIIVGIGLSVIAMIFAAFGKIPPIAGSLLQEGIDIIVIVNALRAARQ